VGLQLRKSYLTPFSYHRFPTQRIAVLAFDIPEPMHEHVMDQQDRAIEKDGFKFLCLRHGDPS
jgi:hypothetical protein